ncbi:MAG: transporter related [Alphaproteobacteria bacterium]|jgi:NitT/TauT family transport system ATP-binding protein|nr:transporter related [Alphaproteobacteria bacterium]
MLEYRGVTKKFYKRDAEVVALRNVSFKIDEGRFVSVVGPSGCGKSTLLNLSAGLSMPTAGEVLYKGKQVTDINTQLGYITQRDNLLEWSTVYDNIVIALRIRRMPRQKQKELADYYLNLMGLTDFAKHYPMELSGGMRKRASLARTLIYSPELVMMDEPFSALDAHVKGMMHEELLRVWELEKKTILFITHDLTEAITLSDQVVVLSARPGTVKAIIDIDLPRPRDPFLLQTTPEFIEIYHRVWELLRDDIRKSEAA